MRIDDLMDYLEDTRGRHGNIRISIEAPYGGVEMVTRANVKRVVKADDYDPDAEFGEFDYDHTGERVVRLAI